MATIMYHASKSKYMNKKKVIKMEKRKIDKRTQRNLKTINGICY